MTPNLAQIVRYPVKSMAGESITHALLTPHGLAGDRLYAFESPAAPPGMLRLTADQRRHMLLYHPKLTREGTVAVQTPDGQTLPISELHFSNQTLTQTPTPQTDVRPLSLISLQTIEHLAQQLGSAVDPRRFRANLYLNLATPFAEDTWPGRLLRIGPTAVLRILERTPRCRFITADPETLTLNPNLIHLLHRQHQSRAGIYAAVLTPGPIHQNDPLTLI